MISGMAHLMCFSGSDTIPAFNGIKKYYNSLDPSKQFMMSVPASEHSVMCAYGINDEIKAFMRMLDTYPSGIVSIVSDTYNIWKVMTEYTSILKDKILSRDGKVVFRPDSGNAEFIICGDPEKDPQSPEGKGCIKLLDEMFGSTINARGFKELNPKVGLIYGDGMYLERYKTVLERLTKMGYASSNLVIGIGGILRNHSRDTLGFAVKATKVRVLNRELSIMKDPITDHGKKSHTGYMGVYKQQGFYENGLYVGPNDFTYITKQDVTLEQEQSNHFVLPSDTGVVCVKNQLSTVFKDGIVYSNETIDSIRKRVDNAIDLDYFNGLDIKRINSQIVRENFCMV
jgi:nicotinamide phosphoribosyltransferase